MLIVRLQRLTIMITWLTILQTFDMGMTAWAMRFCCTASVVGLVARSGFVPRSFIRSLLLKIDLLRCQLYRSRCFTIRHLTFLGCQANTTWTFYRRHGARSLQLLNVLCAASEDNAEKHATFVGLVLLHLLFAWCLVSRITILRKTSSRKFSDDDEFCWLLPSN